MKRKVMVAILGLISLCLVGSITYLQWPQPQNPYLTVSEVWQDPEAWAGEEITLRGWVDYAVEFSSVECGSTFCQCSGISKNLYLTTVDLKQEIYLGQLRCGGEVCSASCRPFDPSVAEAVEVVGVLRVESSGDLRLCHWMPDPGGKTVQARFNRFVKRDICTSQSQVLRTIWSPVDRSWTRPIYGLSFEVVDLQGVRRLVGDGDLHTREIVPFYKSD